MTKIINGSVISYTQQQNVEAQIVQDLPPTASLAIGAGSSGSPSGSSSAFSPRSAPGACSIAR